MSPLVGVDVGTASTKGVLTDEDGRLLASASIGHGMDVPRPGWAEMDPAMWWSDVCAVVPRLLESAEVAATDVSGVGMSAIGPCVVALDADDQPLRPAILYGVDARASTEIDELEAALGRNVIRELSGMDLSSQAVGPKIRWLRRHEREVWKQTRRLTTASSFLVHRLTGRHVIDHHQAGHVIPLYDPTRFAWTDEHADLVADPSLLPELGWSDEVAGTVTPRAAAEVGLAPGTPVVVGGVDAVQEGLSVGVRAPGDLMVMYGSSGFFVLVTDRRRPKPPLWCLPGAFQSTWVLAAGMSTTGSATAWLRDLTRPGEDFDDLFQRAEEVPAGANGLLFLPYLSGERTPIDDPHARGVVAGLSLRHGPDDIFRALLEGVGHGIRQNLALLSEAAPIDQIHAVGGGTTSDTWLQIVSDIAGQPQIVVDDAPGAALGDAFLAAVASGTATVDDLESWRGPQRIVKPDPRQHEFYADAHQDFQRLYTGTRSVVHRLTKW